MIPRVAHFVFGLDEQHPSFHFVHYLSVESCRRHLKPDVIYFHHKHIPQGPYWDRVSPYLELVEVDLQEIPTPDYSAEKAFSPYRCARYSDFVRLDALIKHGGIYADVGTVFVRPFPRALFDGPFVIGRAPSIREQRATQELPSLCNALMLAEPNAPFARMWRERMSRAPNVWSDHGGFLSYALAEELPQDVRIEPETTFFPFPPTPAGVSDLFEANVLIDSETLCVQLWTDLWWERNRPEFGRVHERWCTPSVLRRAQTTVARLAQPFLSDSATAAKGTTTIGIPLPNRWLYLSFDGVSGYGVAADRCRAALESSGLEVDWTPFVPGAAWGLDHSYQPAPGLDPFAGSDVAQSIQSPESALATDAPTVRPRHREVIVAHLLPDYFPLVRERSPDSFLVGHTAWETDRIPDHWVSCLNCADLVVVPSRFNAQVIASSPVSTPVVVVPHVAPTLTPCQSETWAAIPDDVFVFYTIGEWNQRKAVFKTIQAYVRAFSSRDPVLLVVKTTHRDLQVPADPGNRFAAVGTTAWSLANLLSESSDPPAVKLVTRRLVDADLAALHSRGDCFVSLCRGEGWGLGAFDAAAYGNPVVITGFGGQLDYLGNYPFLVGFDLIPAQAPENWNYAPDQRWADPDIAHGADLLRHVYSHREEATAMAQSMSVDIRSRYGPVPVANMFRSAVDLRLGNQTSENRT